MNTDGRTHFHISIWLLFGLLIVLIGVFVGRPAAGLLLGQANKGNARDGFALAQVRCAACHTIGQSRRLSPNPKAQTFAAIATTPGMTSIALNAALRTSHRDMPNLVLTPNESADVIAYILSLQPEETR